MAYLTDQLDGAGPVTSRRMFGEYCLYFAGRPIGLVCNEQLYLKPTEAGRKCMKFPQEGAPFPGARPHLLLTADDWEDREWLCRMVRLTFESLPPPKVPRPKKVSEAAAAPAAPRRLADFPNLGPRSEDMLRSSGIGSVAALRKWGAVAAYARVKQHHPQASLNLLWALEGALTGLAWQVVARDHRTSLLLALEHHMAGALPAGGRSPGRRKG